MNPGTEPGPTAAAPTANDLQLGGQPIDLDHVAALMLRMAGGGTPTMQAPMAPAMPASPMGPFGAAGPSHMAPFSTGATGFESVTLPGNELSNLAGSALLEGIDPSLVSLDLVPLHAIGRDVPGTVPRPPGTPDSASAGGGIPTAGGMPSAGTAPMPGAAASNLGLGFDIGSLASHGAPIAPRELQEGYYFLAPDTSVGTATPRSHPHGGRAPMIRDDFPILQQKINGHRLVWLDSAATTQKPNAVIEREAAFYRHENSNVHRGAHTLAKRSTDAYEAARAKVQRFLGAGAAEEIVFVRSTTEGINLVAQTLGRQTVGAGDEVIVTYLEHHSNIVPWQMLCQEKQAKLLVVPVDDRGELLLDALDRMIGPRTRIVAVPHVSNVIGTLVPITPIAAMAHRRGAKLVVDGAQSVAHVPVDVACMDADFYVFSGHKLYAPTGIGAVYGKKALLESIPPWQGGGSMIDTVTFEETTYAPPPAKFEAGTGHFAGAVGLGAAIDYLEAIGMPQIAAHEQQLILYAQEAMRTVKGLRLIGSPTIRIGALPFVIEGHDPTAIAQWLDKHGIAVRAGHHCAQPILRRFGLSASVRASLGVYSAHDDIDALVAALNTLPAPR